MIDMKSTFKTKRQLFLETVNYELRPVSYSSESESQVKCTDSVTASLVDDRNLKLSFCREINSIDQLVNMKVQFGLVLELLDGVSLEPNKDYADEFIGTSVLSGLILRTSLLISQITASFGQPPLITSPTLIENEN